MAPPSPGAGSLAVQLQQPEQAQLEESGSSDTDSRTEDGSKAALMAKSEPEVLVLSGDEDDLEMVYKGPKITKPVPIQLSSDSDRESLKEATTTPLAAWIDSQISTVISSPGCSADTPTTSAPLLTSPGSSRTLRSRTTITQPKQLLGTSRRSRRGRPGSSLAVEEEFTDYTSSEGEVEERPSSSQRAAAGQSTSAADTDDDAVICNVCKCSLVRGAVRLVPCGHRYHRSCLDDWLRRKKSAFQTCPLCRQPPIEIRRVVGGRKVKIPSPVPDNATSEDDEMLTGMVFSSDEFVDAAAREESDSNFSDEADPALQRAIRRSLSEPVTREVTMQAAESRWEQNRSSSATMNLDDPQHFLSRVIDDVVVAAGEEAAADVGDVGEITEDVSRPSSRIEPDDYVDIDGLQESQGVEEEEEEIVDVVSRSPVSIDISDDEMESNGEKMDGGEKRADAASLSPILIESSDEERDSDIREVSPIGGKNEDAVEVLSRAPSRMEIDDDKRESDGEKTGIREESVDGGEEKKHADDVPSRSPVRIEFGDDDRESDKERKMEVTEGWLVGGKEEEVAEVLSGSPSRKAPSDDKNTFDGERMEVRERTPVGGKGEEVVELLSRSPPYKESGDNGKKPVDERMDVGEDWLDDINLSDYLSQSLSTVDSSEEKDSDGKKMDLTSRRRVLTRRRQKEESEDSDARARREDEEEEEEKRRVLISRSQRMVAQEERDLERCRARLGSRSWEHRAAKGEQVERMDEGEKNIAIPAVASDQKAGEEEQTKKSEDVVEAVEESGKEKDAEALADKETLDDDGEQGLLVKNAVKSNGQEAVDPLENAEDGKKTGEDKEGGRAAEDERGDDVSHSKPSSPYECLPLAPRPLMCSPPHLDFASLAAAQIPPEAAAALAVAMPSITPKESEVIEEEQSVDRLIDKPIPTIFQALQSVMMEDDSKQHDSSGSHEDVPSSSADASARQTRPKSKPVKHISSSPPNSPLCGDSAAYTGLRVKTETNLQDILTSSSLDASFTKNEPAPSYKPVEELDMSSISPRQTYFPVNYGRNTAKSSRKKKRFIDKIRPHMYDFDVFHPSSTELSPSSPHNQQSSPDLSKPLRHHRTSYSPTSSHSMDSEEPPVKRRKKKKLIERMRSHMYDYFDMMRELEHREDLHEEPCSSQDLRMSENMMSPTPIRSQNLLVIPPPTPSPPPRRRTASVIVDEESTEKARQSGSSSCSPTFNAHLELLAASRRRREEREKEIELHSSSMRLAPSITLTTARQTSRSATVEEEGTPEPKRRKISTSVDRSIDEIQMRMRRSESFLDRPSTAMSAASDNSAHSATPDAPVAPVPGLLRAQSPTLQVQRMRTPEINRILTSAMPVEEEANMADETVNDALKEALDAWYDKVLRAGGRVGKRMLTTAIKMALQNDEAVDMGKKQAWIPNSDWDPYVDKTASVAIQTMSTSSSSEVTPAPVDAVSRSEFNEMVREMAEMKRRLEEVERRE